jgi:hypothetical protein
VANVFIDLSESPVTIFTMREEPSGLFTVFSTKNYFKDSKVEIRRIKDFSIKGDILLATKVEGVKKVTEADAEKDVEILSLWLARKTDDGSFGPLIEAKFPSELTSPEHFLVADVSQGQALVVAMQDGKGDLYVSKTVSTNSTGDGSAVTEATNQLDDIHLRRYRLR